METTQQTTTQKKQVKKTNTFVKVLVLLALIVLLIVGILLPIKIVPNALTNFGGGLSNLFKGTEKIILTTDTPNIQSGTPFTLKWNGSKHSGGNYIFNYECRAGVRFLTTINEPNQEIHCSTPFYINADQQSIVITAISESNRYVDVPVTLGFLKTDSTEPTKLADTLLTITNSAITDSRSTISTSTPSTPVVTQPATTTQPVATVATTTPVKPKPSSSTAPRVIRNSAHPASNPNGIADLNLVLISTGYVNIYNNQFVPSYSVPNGGRAAIQFEVINDGDKNSGQWSFTANLPSSTHPTFNSPVQQNLGPGDRIVYTLSFDNFNRNISQNLRITVDPNNYVTDANRANNILSTQIY